jgi:hypothetical protein
LLSSCYFWVSENFLGNINGPYVQSQLITPKNMLLQEEHYIKHWNSAFDIDKNINEFENQYSVLELSVTSGINLD